MNEKPGKPASFVFPLVLSGLLFLSLVLASGGSAADDDDNAEGFIGITGLLINDTISKAGNDFFTAFNSQWIPVEGLDYTITITEKPDRIFGSQFWVKVDETLVYGGLLNPRMELIEATAKEARKKVSIFLLERIIVSRELELY